MEVEKLLSELIKLKTENPPGNEIMVAEYLKKLFDSSGIENEIIVSTPGRAHFLASTGRGAKSLLYLSHSDVVPAGDGWDFDPFSGEIRNGLVLGRGALDCKGLMAAQAFAFLHLAKNTRLNGRLVFAATADEEIGGNFGVKYLMEKHPGRLKADFVINEGGEEPKKVNGKLVYFIQVGEKSTAWTRLKARGVSCHGSVPLLGDNAVVKMARAMAALAGYKPRILLVPEIKELLQSLASLKGVSTEIDGENVDSFIQQFDDKNMLAYLNAVTRMTVSPNVIHGGLKTNIVPDKCEVSVDIRILPGQDREYVVSELQKTIGTDIEIDIPVVGKPAVSSSTSPQYRLMVETLQNTAGDVEVLPCFSTGATDSRFLREAGIQAYGEGVFSPDYDPSIVSTMHGKNERIDIKSLRLKTRFLIDLAKNYLS